MEFCHIAPIDYVGLVENHKRHLVLAHLVETNPKYVEVYNNVKKTYNSTIIMDNSAFELFKSGKPMFEPEKLVDLGKKIGADFIVLPDYPCERWQKTFEKGLEYSEVFHKNGFKTFFVPQSLRGDLKGYIECVKNALETEVFDLIGLSILACPTALGLKENKYNNKVDGLYKMQRYLSRFRILSELKYHGLLDSKALSRFHCLGMTEGPMELELLSPFSQYIQSWDSSSSVWHGINHIRYDMSSTGLANGKLETEVDFSLSYNEDTRDDIMFNVNFIDSLIERLY